MTRLAERGEALTQRQQAIVDLVAEGLTNSQIGQRLFISTDTVKTHLVRAFRKTGAVSRAGLAATWSTPRPLQASTEMLTYLAELRVQRAEPKHPFGSTAMFRQEGELAVIDHLLKRTQPAQGAS
jgi:DNA-binding CsgD family transcriptional regulator